MDTMKRFAKYLILFLLFYVFVSVMSLLLVKSNYVAIENCNIKCTNPKIEIDDAKATKVGGFVQGKVTNESGETINNKYIRVDFISERGNRITSKFILVDGFKSGENLDFKLNFSAENIKSIEVDLVEAKEIDEKNEKMKFQILEVASSLIILLTAVKLIKWII